MKKLLFLLPFFISSIHAQTIKCKVVDVTDGNSVSCITEQQEKIEVKLYQLRAPKLNQHYGQEAKQALSDRVLNQHVTIKKQNKHGAISGTVFYWYSRFDGDMVPSGNCLRSIYLSEEEMRAQTKTCGPWPMVIVDVNYELLKQGYAKHHALTKKISEYRDAEQYARKNKLGLWSKP